MTSYEIRFPDSFAPNKTEILPWFRKIKRLLLSEPIDLVSSHTCNMVPSGTDHKSPSWRITSFVHMGAFNPLLFIAGKQMFLRSLVKLCFGQAWWIRLIWMTKLLPSLPYSERIDELAGFILWTWRRYSRPWEGAFMPSLIGELKNSMISLRALTDEQAYELLDLPTLNEFAHPSMDFRRTWNVTPENSGWIEEEYQKVSKMHIYPIKEFHALPEEHGRATYKWFEK